jgi:RHS repeat-associated protein
VAFAQAQDTVIYYHTDAIGSVRMITDQNGQVVARYDYLPFGEPWVPPPPQNQDVRQFAGKERDPETGFDYFGARYYQSQTGRFTTVDPVLEIEQAVADPQRWNRYTYVRNNPFRYVDPDGRAIETLWDVASLGMSIRAVRQDPTSIWNWVSVGADIASVVAPGIPAIGMAIRSGGKIDDAIDVARIELRAGSGPAEGVLEISRSFKSSKAVQNYAGQGAEFVFDAASGRFVMGTMKHSDLVKKAGIEASNTTVGGIIRRRGGKLVTDEQSGTYWRNWTPEMRKKFREFLNENSLSIEHLE